MADAKAGEYLQLLWWRPRATRSGTSSAILGVTRRARSCTRSPRPREDGSEGQVGGPLAAGSKIPKLKASTASQEDRQEDEMVEMEIERQDSSGAATTSSTSGSIRTGPSPSGARRSGTATTSRARAR